MKVLVGSPIHQKPEILKEFLISLRELNKDEIDIHYFFIEDNVIEESSLLLANFKEEEENVTILRNDHVSSLYICDDYTHRWTNDLIRKVAKFKNAMIQRAIEEDFDYLFLIDSDLILHPNTLKRLVSLKKELVSNIFWTKWQPNSSEQPQVWLSDTYNLYDSEPGEHVSDEDITRRTEAFLNMLRKPGTYKVGGLGACTLIANSALNKGVSFDNVYNISFWGEDRHFCVRAAALGMDLYVDTYYPAHHIYRSEDLLKIAAYKMLNKTRDLQIYSTKVQEVLKLAIEGIGDYNYKKGIQTEYLKYFKGDEKQRLENELNTISKELLEDEIMNKIKVLSYQEIFSKQLDEMTIKATYAEEGRKNGFTYYKEKQAEFTLEKDKEENFKITKWIVEKEIEPSVKPLIRKVKEENNKLTLSMVVKNEGEKFLRRVLEDAVQYIDNAIIIDDGSTDNTVEIIKEVLKDIPYVLIENTSSKFSNEVTLRKQQWDETIKTNPDWILFLDADEIFEDKFKYTVRELMKNAEVDGYMFRLYDFWDERHYREDHLWNAHNVYRLFMVRYQENYHYVFKETPQHCGRLPYNCNNLSYALSDLRLKHYGWSVLEHRKEKYNRYMALDPDGVYGLLDQYYSILDETPNLKKWEE